MYFSKKKTLVWVKGNSCSKTWWKFICKTTYLIYFKQCKQGLFLYLWRIMSFSNSHYFSSNKFEQLLFGLNICSSNSWPPQLFGLIYMLESCIGLTNSNLLIPNKICNICGSLHLCYLHLSICLSSLCIFHPFYFVSLLECFLKKPSKL